MSPLLLTTAIACTMMPPEYDPGDYLFLEAVDVASETGEPHEDGFSGSGLLGVSGSGRDFRLELAHGADGAEGADLEAILVHTPTEADLSLLDGREVALRGEPVAGGEGYNLVVSDDTGPLYVAIAGEGDELVAELFGADFVRLGEDQGRARDDTFEWEFYSLVFRTDDGDLELQSGDVAYARVGGETWRIGVVAVYDRSPEEDAALPGCPFVEDLVSFEMIRVSEERTDDFLDPADRAEVARLGCM